MHQPTDGVQRITCQIYNLQKCGLHYWNLTFCQEKEVDLNEDIFSGKYAYRQYLSENLKPLSVAHC